MNNSPFETARAIGTNMASAFQNYSDKSSIESILSQAMDTEDPEVINNSIGQILSHVSPERQGPALQLLQNMAQNIDRRKQLQQKQMQDRQQLDALERQRGLVPGALSGFEGNLNMAEKASRDLAGKGGSTEPGAKKYHEAIATDVAKYVGNALQKGQEADDMEIAMAEIDQAIEGDITGPGLMAIAKDNPFLQLFIGLTPDEATLKAANKKVLEGSAGIFGARPTEREIFLLLEEMLPSISKTPAANKAGMEVIKRRNDIAKLHAQIVDELTEGGAKYVPNIKSLAAVKMEPYAKEFLKELQAKKVATMEKKSGKQSKPEQLSLSQQLEAKARARREQRQMNPMQTKNPIQPQSTPRAPNPVPNLRQNSMMYGGML